MERMIWTLPEAIQKIEELEARVQQLTEQLITIRGQLMDRQAGINLSSGQH